MGKNNNFLVQFFTNEIPRNGSIVKIFRPTAGGFQIWRFYPLINKKNRHFIRYLLGVSAMPIFRDLEGIKPLRQLLLSEIAVYSSLGSNGLELDVELGEAKD